MKKFVCKHPWSHFEVNNPNGDVTMCCNNDTVLGNVNDNSVEEIWNGEAFQDNRARMRTEGAYAMCPHTCPVLQGGKKYENLDWFVELSEDSEQRLNAAFNEREYNERLSILGSFPRWFRFTYSYACNLDCYHCYQREDAKMRVKLPQRFMAEISKYAKKAQVVFPFGGEPFYFNPVVDFLEQHNSNLETKFYFITNGTLLTDRIYKTLERLPITCLAVSLDAASEKTFDHLRVRGRNAEWKTVIENLQKLRALKKRKDFNFTLSMTLNSYNCHEIRTFVELALSYDAEPLIILVANPHQTRDFQECFLNFSAIQFEEMQESIEEMLPRVRERGFEDAEVYLKQLQKILRLHRDSDNSITHFQIKKIARKTFHAIPEQLQIPVRKLVQKSRIKKLEKY